MPTRNKTFPYQLNPQECVLVIIDIQDRLTPTMDPTRLNQVIGQTNLLATLAHELKIPIVLTEQYPQGLGNTLSSVKEILADKPHELVEKVSFGCCGEKKFLEKLLALHRRQIILVGMETHICVYLTAIGLLEHGYQPFIASDAVIARAPFYDENGLDLMRQAGCCISNTETLLFQLMGQSGGPVFKKISNLLKETIKKRSE